MSYVVDASAIAELLVSERLGEAVATEIVSHELFAPQLLIPEVLSVVRGWVHGQHLDSQRAEGALVDLQELGVRLMDMMVLVDVAWSLRDNVSPYDAMYVSLARALGYPLLTTNARLARAVPADVKLIA